MSSTRARLGRGLSALLGDVDPSVARATQPDDVIAADDSPPPPMPEDATPTPTLEPASEVEPVSDAANPVDDAADDYKVVPISWLERNPDQPRTIFGEAELEELAASIRDRGILQPILVRPIVGQPDSYQIVAGERRWRAAQRAQLHAVPVIVRQLSDQKVLEISIIENVQRKDLNPLDEAGGYQALIDQFGHTQEEIAKAIGKSRSHVANALRLLALPERVRDLVRDAKLSAGHARAIAAAPDPSALAERIIAGGLSVRDAEALARGAHDAPGSAPRPVRTPSKDADTLMLEKEIAEALGLIVDIRHKGDAGGEIRLRYSQVDQLHEVCRLLRARAAA